MVGRLLWGVMGLRTTGSLCGVNVSSVWVWGCFFAAANLARDRLRDAAVRGEGIFAWRNECGLVLGYGGRWRKIMGGRW